MDIKTFITGISQNDAPDPTLSETLKALWWDRKGDWDRAHAIAQDIPTAAGSAVHAYLHREEGVMWNADYWYRRGRTQAAGYLPGSGMGSVGAGNAELGNKHALGPVGGWMVEGVLLLSAFSPEL